MNRKSPVTNVRALATEVIFNILHDNKSLSVALSEQELANKNIDPKDISFLKALCFGFFRNYFLLDAIVKRLLAKPLPSKELIIKIIIMLGLYQIIYMRTPSYAAINEAVNSSKYFQKPWATKLVNAVLREFLREQPNLEKAVSNQLEVTYQHPRFFIDLLKKHYPDDWQDILNNNNNQAPLTIRINKLQTNKQKFLHLISQENIAYTKTDLSDTCVYLDPQTNIHNLTSFKEGLFSVQDLSAQVASLLLAPQPLERILDACSAPGGKTCHLLEIEPNVNEIIALDINAKRLQLLQHNIARLKLPNKIKIVCNDAKNTKAWFDGKMFDKILLDAPCSATGIIRRQPDIKLLRTKENIKDLNKQQLELLTALWPTLKPGGILLYATCSILPEENYLVLQKFIATESDAMAINFPEFIKNLNFARKEPIGIQILPGIYVTADSNAPTVNNMDGFYYALLQKRSASAVTI